jgi:hypothetical protein
MAGAIKARPVTLSPQKLAIQVWTEIEGCRCPGMLSHVRQIEGGSMIRQSVLQAAVLVVFGGFVAGCSETGFQDFIGAGKYAPDETQVSVNQPLSVPPDLQLRPPSNEQPQTVASVPQDTQQPASGDLQQPQDLTLSAPADPAAPQAEPQPQQQADLGQPQDIYARWGVSRHHPDGREKSQIELNAEMREKQLEVKRQQDPNYGTIWNLGSIWSDG